MAWFGVVLDGGEVRLRAEVFAGWDVCGGVEDGLELYLVERRVERPGDAGFAEAHVASAGDEVARFPGTSPFEEILQVLCGRYQRRLHVSSLIAIMILFRHEFLSRRES